VTPAQLDTLCRSIVANTNDLITVFDRQGRIHYVNNASTAMLGVTPDQVIGRNIIEFVHPEEQARATSILSITSAAGALGGTVEFRLRCADGGYLRLEFTVAHVTAGETRLFMTLGRNRDSRFGLERAMESMLGDGGIAEVMRHVCDIFAWQTLGSRIALWWVDPDGEEHWVATGDVPAALCGHAAPPASPWSVVRQSGVRLAAEHLADLPADLRTLAEDLGLSAYWIEPIDDARGGRGLITIWTRADRPNPEVHMHGLEVARHTAQLVFRWFDQKAALDFAANHDHLTGLPNRQAFFRALEQPAHGAILYCDLDRFKPVNDQFGHAAGDEVLRETARRLRASVRQDDLVARIGGDEFAALCPGSSAADAELVANRIRAAIGAPFHLAHGDVSLGVTVGVVHTTDTLDAASLAAADRLLLEAKAQRRRER
jgi:diguanylate cyclase (GGDEF)-like protein/PAS domain S-box-containing protein